MNSVYQSRKDICKYVFTTIEYTKTKDLLSLFTAVSSYVDEDLRSRIKRILTLGDVKSTIAENRLKAFV